MMQQIFGSLLVRCLLIIAGFVSSIIVSRFLGPEGRGVFFYWSTLAALIIQFSNLGLHSSNTYYLTKGQAKISTLAANSALISIVSLVVFGSLLLFALLLPVPIFQDQWLFLFLTLLLIPTGLYFLLGTNLLVALGRIGEYNCFELINRYMGLAAILFAVWYWQTPQSLIIAMIFNSTIICFILYYRMQIIGGKDKFNLRLICNGCGYALRAYIGSVLAFMVLRANAFLLEWFSGKAMVGYWSLAVQILDIINVIPSTVALILLPKIMRTKKAFRMMCSQLLMVTFVLLLVCIFSVWLGRDFIVLIYGEQFSKAYDILLRGLPGALSLGLISIASQYLAAIGMPITLLWIWLVGLIIEVCMSCWLIPILGGEGAMISLSIAYTVILGFVLWLAIYCNSFQRLVKCEKTNQVS